MSRANVQPSLVSLEELESTEDADVTVADELLRIRGGNGIHVAVALGAHRLVHDLLNTHRDFSLDFKVTKFDTTYEVDGATAVHIAAIRGDTEMMSVLSKWNADINALSRDGMDALLFAADQGNLQMVRLLLSEGAFISQKSRVENAESEKVQLHSSHPIHLAALGGHHEVVLEILKTGKVDVNLKSHFGTGDTSLHAAAQSGNLETVKLLIEHGADLTSQSSDGLTALDLADGNQAIIDYLQQKLNEPHNVDVNVKPIGQKTHDAFFSPSDGEKELEEPLDLKKFNLTQCKAEIERKDAERESNILRQAKLYRDAISHLGVKKIELFSPELLDEAEKQGLLDDAPLPTPLEDLELLEDEEEQTNEGKDGKKEDEEEEEEEDTYPSKLPHPVDVIFKDLPVPRERLILPENERVAKASISPLKAIAKKPKAEMLTDIVHSLKTRGAAVIDNWLGNEFFNGIKNETEKIFDVGEDRGGPLWVSMPVEIGYFPPTVNIRELSRIVREDLNLMPENIILPDSPFPGVRDEDTAPEEIFVSQTITPNKYLKNLVEVVDKLRLDINKEMKYELYFNRRSMGRISHFHPFGAEFKPHNDSIVNIERVLSVIYFMGTDWRLKDGGNFRLMLDPNTETTVDIPPIKDRLLIYLSEHVYNQVLPTYKDLYFYSTFFAISPDKFA